MITVTKKQELVIDTETTGTNPHKAKLLGVSLYDGKVGQYVDQFPVFYTNKTRNFITHNGKYDAVVLARHGHLVQINCDTLIAYYLLHIDRPRKLEKIVKKLFNVDKEDLQQLYNRCTGKDRKSLPDGWWNEIPEDQLAEYAKQDVYWTYRIKEYCEEQFNEPENKHLKEWFTSVEMPLLNLLVHAELQGMRWNIGRGKALASKLEKRKQYLETRLKWLSSPDLNVRSSKQLGEVLFKQMKLPKIKKTKTGWSTGAKVIEKLASISGFCRLLLEYRELDKLLNTFLIPLTEDAERDEQQRIHCTFNQALTRSRRFSSDSPNLQQIPSKTELGREVKSCFEAKPGYKLVSIDYSQIELRLLAHFSKEPSMMKAFMEDKDIHQETANEMGETRDRAKTINFSILYGKSAFGYGQDWDCSEEYAQSVIDKWFLTKPKVKEWMEWQKQDVRKRRSWTQSLAGLPLYVCVTNPKHEEIGNILSEDEWIRAKAERVAVNIKIQGSSQDIIKKAAVEVYNQTGHIFINTIHDQLMYEIEESKAEAEASKIQTIMENVYQLRVPLKADVKISDRWAK